MKDKIVPIDAVIFDMDGVISDTQKLHSKVESVLLRRYGIIILPEEITDKYAGVRTKDFFETLLRRQGMEYDINSLILEKWSEMEKLARESVDEISGAIDLIKMLKKIDLPLAVASASNLNYVEVVLQSLGLAGYFDAVVSGDMVSNGKPDPESFLLAASRLNVNPKKCLVIEDGFSGMEAAKTAGMKCIGLVRDRNRIYPTGNLVTSLTEVSCEYLSCL